MKMSLICKRCIDAIKSRGEEIWVGPLRVDADEVEEENVQCELCDEVDDLYDCKW